MDAGQGRLCWPCCTHGSLLCLHAFTLLPACLPARRVWELGEPALVGEAPEPPRCRELRKGFGERAHSGPVLALACPADGQVVWSASTKGLLLWDAACGAFLGGLQRSSGRQLAPQASQADLGGRGDAADQERRYKIDGAKARGVLDAARGVGVHRHGAQAKAGGCAGGARRPPAAPCLIHAQQGLETDPITGYVVARPTVSEWPRIAADQEAWAAQVCVRGQGAGGRTSGCMPHACAAVNHPTAHICTPPPPPPTHTHTDGQQHQ